ncbi:efflux transporter outer membrane subunit [Sulfurospirillum sp. T05]|uniref:Efflux transporter outer membrane subunit n=1 Tax=Sulfurospirillum tamanense TaxID=2813362 RepID=A0ABS2WRM3_9BACT|nr:efflux transporter outer membrane subunit [Sulfurospirillum tamanensis]MBN2964258.1 efflux transporter outer membrane subunit [Sulfurospirillum tamanensis]
MKWHSFLIGATTLLFLSGCAQLSGPVPLAVATVQGEEKESVSSQWWEAYGDVRLNGLVEEALLYNHDLQTAAANVALASAYLSGAQAQRYPSLSGTASAGRQQTSGETASGAPQARGNAYALSAVLGYELDLWGKLKMADRSATQSLLASKASQDAVRLGLVASVVDSYFAVVALNEQKEIAARTVALREEALDIMRKKLRYGVVSEYEVLANEALVTQAKSTLESIENALVRQKSALHVLLGTAPDKLFGEEVVLERASLPDSITVPEGLPSSLLEQRPDIQAALYALRASNADIHVAKAAHFPSISLSGALGYESAALGNLVRSSANTWSLGGSLVAPLFDFGRVAAGVEQAKAAQELARLAYEQSVYRAFNEVHEALSARQSLAASREYLKTQETIQARLLELSTLRYEKGVSDYLSVLDATRSLLEAQLGVVQAQQAVLSGDISLIKALGGGWNLEDNLKLSNN